MTISIRQKENGVAIFLVAFAIIEIVGIESIFDIIPPHEIRINLSAPNVQNFIIQIQNFIAPIVFIISGILLFLKKKIAWPIAVSSAIFSMIHFSFLLFQSLIEEQFNTQTILQGTFVIVFVSIFFLLCSHSVLTKYQPEPKTWWVSASLCILLILTKFFMY